MKKGKIAAIAIISIFVLLLAGLYFWISGFSYKIKGADNPKISKYPTVTDDFKAEDMGGYTDLTFQIYHTSAFIFYSDASTSVVSYDEQNFAKQKQQIDEKYMFLKEPVKSEFNSSDYVIPEAEFDIGNWHFRVVDKGEKNNYPKDINIIGINETEKKIAYIDFSDPDLDAIDTGKMKKFTKEYIGYKFK